MAEEQPQKELTNYKFSYSFTQTIVGYAAGPTEEEVKEALTSNFGTFEDFTVNYVEQASDEEMQAMFERLEANGERKVVH